MQYAMRQIKVGDMASKVAISPFGVIVHSEVLVEGSVGKTYREGFAPTNEENVDFHIWYPASSGGQQLRRRIAWHTCRARCATYRQAVSDDPDFTRSEW